jgi:putative transposase
MKIIREKKHRLIDEVYIGGRPISFTLCIKDRKQYFTNDYSFQIFEQILIDELKSFDCFAFVYLFMPDHVHLVLGGNNSNSNLKKCLEMFKQKSGYYFSRNTQDIRWQKDYYDHILRSEENLEIHLRYILNNPIRAGIIDYWKRYPYKGSTIYNLREWD